MTTAPTEYHYSPLPAWKDLDRLVVFSPVQDAWADAHDEVQEQLAALERDVRQSVPEARVTTGRTRGERFPLFSYRTFSIPGRDLDPVVVGVTFTTNAEGIAVEADVSGEQAGDLIWVVEKRFVPDARDKLIAAGREAARELSQSAKAIAAALRNPSRSVG